MIQKNIGSKNEINIRKNHKEVANIVLLIDWWEHAWALDYQADKSKYLDNIWKIINWDIVNSRLSIQKESKMNQIKLSRIKQLTKRANRYDISGDFKRAESIDNKIKNIMLSKKAQAINLIDKTTDGITYRRYVELENQCYPADPALFSYDIDDEILDTKITDLSPDDKNELIDIMTEDVLGGDKYTQDGRIIKEMIILGSSDMYVMLAKSDKSIEITDICAKNQDAPPGAGEELAKVLNSMITSGEVDTISLSARESTSYELIKKFVEGFKENNKNYDVSVSEDTPESRPDTNDPNRTERYFPMTIKFTKKEEGDKKPGFFSNIFNRS